MKKFALLLSVILAVLMILPMVVSAEVKVVTENPPVTIPSAAPTIDGVITDGEGWSDPALFNDTTAGNFWAHQALTTTGNLYFAYSNDGIYFAGDMTESNHRECPDQNGNMTNYDGNSFIYSTDLDDLNPNKDGTLNYGWNGDVFAFMIDPLGQFAEYGFGRNEDYTAWYCVGLFEDGTAKMYRSKINPGEITSDVKVAAKVKADNMGWVIEGFIPWDIIVKDTNDMAAGDFEVTEEQMIASGATSRAAVLYQDRFFDEEAGMNDTWGRYITVATTTTAGTPGQLSSGDCVSAYGLHLVNADNKTPGDTTTAGGSDTTKDPASTTKDAGTTTKATSTGTSAGGTTASQTFDAGIAVAIGAMAASGIGIWSAKKSKRK